MTRRAAAPHLPPDDAATAVAALRTVLGAADYSGGTVAERLRIPPGLTLSPPRRRAAGRRLGESSLDTLVRLFVVGGTAPAVQAARVFGAAGLQALLRARVLAAGVRGVQARIAIVPCEGLWLACDRPSGPAARSAAYVGGPSPSSLTLAAITPRARVARALDVGTGCGLHALLAARRGARTVATDVNPRALAYTRFNAALNAVDGVETRAGDLYAPVAGESFGLVLCNPPYVVSPGGGAAYRDGAREDDALSREVVRGATAHLRPGGRAYLLCNWVVAPGAVWDARPRAWVADRGCDALILHARTDAAGDYAAAWVAPRIQGDAARRAEIARWMAYYDARGIAAIASGAIVLRRRDGGSWAAAVPFPDGPARGLRPAVAALFAGQDRRRNVAAADG